MQNPTLYQVAIKSHKHYALVYADRRLSRLLFKVECRQMEQLVGLIIWLREPTKGVRKHNGMGHGQRSELHLSNAPKDTLQLLFSKNGPQVRPSARRHCDRPDGSRHLESHSIPSTGEHYRRGTDSS